jgi:hypothetical protein
MIGCERLDALGEALDEILRRSGGGLVSDSVHDAENVLSAMIDLAHEELQLFLVRLALGLALLAFGNVLDGADEAHGSPLMPGPLETSKPPHLYPMDLAVSPQNPVLMR